MDTFLFKPCNERSQSFMGSLIGLPLIVKHHPMTQQNLGEPSKCKQILGDGNCPFRALSYAVTGRQTYHSVVRAKILRHMKEMEQALVV